MFQDLPETKEVKRIKNDLYLNALDRYDELTTQGKRESEALGTIIIEMGELKLLLDEFGYNKEQDLKNYSLNTLEEAKHYIQFNRSESGKIALGVFLILLGTGLIPTLYTFNAAMIGVILFLILLAIAVGMFSMSGIKTQNLESKMDYPNNIFYLSDNDYDKIFNQFINFKEKEGFRIPIGIMLSIVAVIPLIIFTYMERELLIERFGILILMTTIGLGVSQFIKYGVVNSAFEKVLSVGEYSEEEQKIQNKMDPIASIYWISITIIFLIWSFITMDWHISWIIWPIAGFFWAIISILLGMFIEKDGI